MVLALVGFRKAMDFFPNVFSQQDLFWLDNLMPSSSDKKSDEDDENPDSVSDRDTQCGNFRVFLSLRFYVKSNSGVLEVQKVSLFAVLKPLFLNLVHFSCLKMQKCIKMQSL